MGVIFPTLISCKTFQLHSTPESRGRVDLYIYICLYISLCIYIYISFLYCSFAWLRLLLLFIPLRQSPEGDEFYGKNRRTVRAGENRSRNRRSKSFGFTIVRKDRVVGVFFVVIFSTRSGLVFSLLFGLDIEKAEKRISGIE